MYRSDYQQKFHKIMPYIFFKSNKQPHPSVKRTSVTPDWELVLLRSASATYPMHPRQIHNASAVHPIHPQPIGSVRSTSTVHPQPIRCIHDVSVYPQLIRCTADAMRMHRIGCRWTANAVRMHRIGFGCTAVPFRMHRIGCGGVIVDASDPWWDCGSYLDIHTLLQMPMFTS